MPWLRLYVAPPFANRRIPPFNSRRTHRILRSPRKSPEKRLRLSVAPPFANRRTPLYSSSYTMYLMGVHLMGVHLNVHLISVHLTAYIS
jgi:hypothetical protein